MCFQIVLITCKTVLQHYKRHCPRMWHEFYFVQEDFHLHVNEGTC